MAAARVRARRGAGRASSRSPFDSGGCAARRVCGIGAGAAAASMALKDRLGRAATTVRALGPGLITGAADDDPGGLATYSQAGAQFGFGLTWTMPFTFLLLASMQEISARIGRVTGQGLAASLRGAFPRPVLVLVVSLLLIANTINLGADLGAMGEATALIVGGPGHLYVVLFGAFCAGAQILLPYKPYVRLLKWLTLSLFFYVGAAFSLQVPWGAVLVGTLLPKISWTPDYLMAVVAVLGTTLSPYLLFWQASEEAEDVVANGGAALRQVPAQGGAEMRRIRLDSYIGIGFSNLIGLFVIVTTAATLHASGVRDIGTAAEAATALRPIAGPFAFFAFAAGIIGTGLLAVPILAGSSAYAVTEAFGRPVGLSLKPARAAMFYSTLALSTALGVGMHFLPVPPMKLLYWSAVLNGVVVAPVMAITVIVASRPKTMGGFVLPLPLRMVGGAATAVMAVAVLAMFAAWLKPS